jgi:hypothetical protein
MTPRLAEIIARMVEAKLGGQDEFDTAAARCPGPSRPVSIGRIQISRPGNGRAGPEATTKGGR